MWHWLERLFPSAPEGTVALLSAGISRRDGGYYGNLACGHKVPMGATQVGKFCLGELNTLACPTCELGVRPSR
jgi:hypothetical protein